MQIKFLFIGEDFFDAGRLQKSQVVFKKLILIFVKYIP